MNINLLTSSMTTVASFNQLLKSFLTEIVEVFPDDPAASKVELFLATFDTIVAGSNARMAMDLFMKEISPHADAITAKDESLFDALTLPGDISLRPLWEQASDNTKDCVWQYLQMLFLIGTTASVLPDTMLAGIEDMASKYAKQVQDGELDLSSLTTMLLGGGLGGDLGDVGNLLKQIMPDSDN